MNRIKRLLVASGAVAVLAASPALFSPASAQAAVVGVCTITVGEPHNSHHVVTKINSFGRLVCTIGMPNMHVRTTLERSTGTTWSGPTEDWNNVPAYKTLTSTSAINCVKGVFRTKVSIAFTAPPGYSPAYHAKTYTSIWRTISRCDQGGGPSLLSVDAPEQEVSIALLDDGTSRDATRDEAAPIER